jgi:hypothetical protein
MIRKLMKNAMGFRDRLGRGVPLLSLGEKIIFSAAIPPDQ